MSPKYFQLKSLKAIEIFSCYQKQWENKLKKIKISTDPKDWRNIKNILGMEKEKSEYPDLTLGNKKAVTNEEKVKLFKQFLESIFITEPEHKISDQEKILIEMDILNDNDLEMLELNENHKDIKIEELTNIINKLDIKKACGENKIANKLIKLTYNSTKDFLFKLFNSSLYYPNVFKKSQITMLHKPGKPKSEIPSYRSLSLTSCLGKILQKIITNRVKDWCTKMI